MSVNLDIRGCSLLWCSLLLETRLVLPKYGIQHPEGTFEVFIDNI